VTRHATPGRITFAIFMMTFPWRAAAFPPYRSTDADTAAPWMLETRLGLLRVQREGDETTYSSPLLRVNLGLPADTEIVTEFEYRADEAEAADAAVGFKWVPLRWIVNAGAETLALLPVADDSDDAGIESQLLLTKERAALLLHLNAGGFYDARPAGAESGWRSSFLAEYKFGRFKPGIEFFAKQVDDAPVQFSAGGGLITDVGHFDLRLGAEVGLTDEAPDLRVNLWIASKIPLH
jgi:hypothetical protein